MRNEFRLPNLEELPNLMNLSDPASRIVSLLAFFFLLIPALIAPIFILYGIRRGNEVKLRIRGNLCSLIGIVAVAASFFMNMGWIRFLLILIGTVPMIGHGIAFFWLNHMAIVHLPASKPLQIVMPLSFSCYLGTYFCIPDGGDTGPTGAFFYLIQGDFGEKLGYLAPVFLAGSVACMILQIIFTVKAKKQGLENTEQRDGRIFRLLTFRLFCVMLKKREVLI